MQRQFGDLAQRTFTALTDTRFERRDVQDWDFGALPEFVELERNGVRVRGYPALSVADGRIDLALFDQETAARAAHREGLLALFRKRLGSLVKEIKRSIPELDKQALWFSTIAGAEVLQADLERAVLLDAFLRQDAAIRDPATFQRRFEAGRGQLLALRKEVRCRGS